MTLTLQGPETLSSELELDPNIWLLKSPASQDHEYQAWMMWDEVWAGAGQDSEVPSRTGPTGLGRAEKMASET